MNLTTFSINPNFSPLKMITDGEQGCNYPEIINPFFKKDSTPYDAGAGVNYPGITNAFFIPYDLFCTLKALVHAIKKFDEEEFVDSFFRLNGLPPSLMYVLGGSAFYAKLFGIFNHIPLALTLSGMTVGGGLLCVFELIVESISLLRQKRFEQKHHFEPLSALRTLLFDLPTHPKKIVRTIEKIEQFVKKNRRNRSINRNAINTLQKWIASAYQKKTGNPEELLKYVKESSPLLKAVTKKILTDHLENIHDTYLSITNQEIEAIENMLLMKAPNLKQKETAPLEEKALRDLLIKKQTKLARRIRPWLVQETNQALPLLIPKIRADDARSLKEGLQLSEEIWIQSKKKKIAHLLAILTLLFAMISLACLLITSPVAIPYVVSGVAFTFGCLRFGLFSGTLDSRGWTFEPKKMLPLWIRKKLFSDADLSPIRQYPYQKNEEPKNLSVRSVESLPSPIQK